MKNLEKEGQQKTGNQDLAQTAEIAYAANEADVRPWGRWRVLCVESGYIIKELTVNPGGTLSLQFHRHRNESWTVVAGCGKATIGNRTIELAAGSSAYIPARSTHRLINTGTAPLIVIETQTGDRLEEADIVRLDDIYGRS